MRRFITEYTAEDGSEWAGPLIVAESLELAQALNLCLQGPSGQHLRLLGELIQQIPAEGGDTLSVVRRN